MLRILIIDDEKIILELLEIGLTRLGYEVETASAGLEGLRRFEEGDFDVVITDIHMPDLNGFDVAQRIRKSAKCNTAIIGISGMVQDLEFEGFDYVFPKPFKVQKLAESIEELMEQKGLREPLLNRNVSADRRNFLRVQVEGKADAVLSGPDFSKTVQILDVSKGGVGFRYVNGRDPLTGEFELDIFWDHVGLYLAKLKIKTVSDEEVPDQFIPGAFPIRRCGASFVKPSEDQLTKIEDFLEGQSPAGTCNNGPDMGH